MDIRNIVIISNMLKISHEKKCLDVPGPQKCCNIQQNSNHSLKQFNTMITELITCPTQKQYQAISRYPNTEIEFKISFFFNNKWAEMN